MRNAYPCDQCGRMTTSSRLLNGMRLCSKHFTQFNKYGKFLDNNPRTIFDPNQIDIDEENQIAKIHLYNNQCEEVGIATIDLEDLPLVQDFKWKLSKSGYAQYTPGREKSSQNKSMHRVIMGLSNDDPRFVDHVNHDKLYNRKHNLRIVNKSKNAMNMNTKGVYQYGNKWGVRIKLNQIRFTLAIFDSEEEALYARWYAETLVFRQYRYDKCEPDIDPGLKAGIRSFIYKKIYDQRAKWDGIHIYNASENILGYLPQDVVPINIDVIITKKNPRLKTYKRLLPNLDDYREWERKKDHPNFYEKYAQRILTPLDQDLVINDLRELSGGKDVVLITKHKNKTTVDHRYLVMRWFEEYAIPCPELRKGIIQDILDTDEQGTDSLLDVV